MPYAHNRHRLFHCRQIRSICHVQVLELHPGKSAGPAGPEPAEDPAPFDKNTLHGQHQQTDIKQMFKFQGHFEPPNNPELAAIHQQIGVHRPQTVTSADAHSTGQVAHQDHAPHMSSINSEMLSDATSISFCQPDAADVLHPTSASCAALHQQQHQSDFRRSHSPEWYDAKFKSYQLR